MTSPINLFSQKSIIISDMQFADLFDKIAFRN